MPKLIVTTEFEFDGHHYESGTIIECDELFARLLVRARHANPAPDDAVVETRKQSRKGKKDED